jgi:hypothetical protein
MITAFSYLLRTANHSLANVESLSTATAEIHNIMEQLRALPFERLAAQNNGAFANGRGKIKISTVFNDLIKIELEHKWHDQKAPLTLTTLRSPY